MSTRQIGDGWRNRALVWLLTGPLGRFAAFLGDLAAAGRRWAARRIRDRRQ